MKRQLIFLTLLTALNTRGQDTINGIYEARRIGYFHAILIIFPDSTYAYSEWNHRRKKIQDQGKIIYKDSLFYLKSDLLKPKRKDKFLTTNKFQFLNVAILSDKIVIPPCNDALPEYCTYHRQKNSKKR